MMHLTGTKTRPNGLDLSELSFFFSELSKRKTECLGSVLLHMQILPLALSVELSMAPEK